MLTENDITYYLVKYLELEGYTDVRGLTTLQRGIDVTAVNKYGVQLSVEVKGETSSKPGTNRYKLPFTGNQIASHIGAALMKTIVMINDNEYKNCAFGMAFPLNHEILIRRILPSLQKLEITIFLVSTEKVVIL